MIETLPLLTPNAQRSEKTITRCHQRLARRRKSMRTDVSRADSTYLAVERAVIGGLCVIYISGVALIAIHVLIGG